MDLARIDLEQLRLQFRGSRYADLVAHHIKRQRQREIYHGILGTIELLPGTLQSVTKIFVERWNTQAYDGMLWNRDTAEVFDEILDDAKKFAASHGVIADDDTLFNLFNIVTLNYAYSAYDQPEMQAFMGITAAFPLISALSLLYPIGAFVYALLSGMPLVPALGYGIGNLSYLLAIAGFFGRFRVFGLMTRRSVWITALAVFTISLALSNIGYY